jgi:D-lactate dehydrogenase (cytochrome)
MDDLSAPPPRLAVLGRLDALVGADNVLTGAAMLPYVTDVYRRLELPVAAVRPPDVQALQAVVREAAAATLAIYTRGGGASYTDGYLPTRAQSVLIDLGRLDRIIEINEEDAYVTVEAGVTWAALKAALDPLGLRTPFFGPFSGYAASIGGSVSQNSLSHGSGAHGISAQSVQSLDVVLASGEILRTGSAAKGGAPFARFHGPDLTGLFTGDCGVLGVKARITLPLLRAKPAFQCASFAFGSFADLTGAMRLAAMERLDDEHFAIDAALAQGQIARQANAGAMLGMARAVLASSPSLASGALQLMRMATAGTRAMGEARFMLHFILDGASDLEAKAKLGRLRRLMAAGVEIPNSIPAVVRGMPFAPLFNTLGPRGERWAPLHGILPHSQAALFHDALTALYAERAADMKRLGVWTGAMFETTGPSSLLYEVALYWPGPPTDYHRAVLPADYLAGLPAYAQDDEAQAYVERLKSDIVALLARFGAVHFQLGKMYPYAQALDPEPLALVRALKAALDPQGLMNPGALGL